MENKENPVLFVSVIFGAAFAIGHLVLWFFILKDFTGFENIFYPGIEIKEVLLISSIPLITIITFTALFFNIAAIIKNKTGYLLISGILYILSFNIFAFPLLFVEFANNKSRIKDKLYFIVIAYTFILNIAFSLLLVFVAKDSVIYGDTSMIVFTVYFIICSFLGLLFNILAWLKGTRWLKVISGAFYLLSIFNVVSAIFSFIYTKENKEPIRDKFFFHVLECTVLINLFLFLFFIIVILASPGDNVVAGIFIYFIAASALGILFNILAWHDGKKELKIVSGIFYAISFFNIISAVFSFIYCRVNTKKVTINDK